MKKPTLKIQKSIHMDDWIVVDSADNTLATLRKERVFSNGHLGATLWTLFIGKEIVFLTKGMLTEEAKKAAIQYVRDTAK